MRLFDYILNESLHSKTREAKGILMASGMPEKEAHALALKIESDDPYKDAGKLFTPVMANWVANGAVQSYDEHLSDIEKYKENRKMLNSKKVTIVNLKKKKKLLEYNPEDFMHHYLSLQEWNRACQALFDDGKHDNSAKEIEVAKYNGYTMYKIDKKKHLKIPLVKNKMDWCVTKRYFGQFGGPPYYAIMKDSDNSQFAMIIPKYINEASQAFRNGKNDGILSADEVDKVRPLIQMIMHRNIDHPFIRLLYGEKIKTKIPHWAYFALTEMKLSDSEKEEMETVISFSKHYSYEYALSKEEGERFEKGEDEISKTGFSSLKYAQHLGKGVRFEKGEKAISESDIESMIYAQHLGKGVRFEMGEDAISKNAHLSFKYAEHIGGRFPKGEKSICSVRSLRIRYAKLIGSRFEMAEHEIAESPDDSLEYAGIIKDRFKLGEYTIFHYGDDFMWEGYRSFLKSIGIEPPDKPWESGDPE
jgi:hypothetical protein